MSDTVHAAFDGRAINLEDEIRAYGWTPEQIAGFIRLWDEIMTRVAPHLNVLSVDEPGDDPPKRSVSDPVERVAQWVIDAREVAQPVPVVYGEPRVPFGGRVKWVIPKADMPTIPALGWSTEQIADFRRELDEIIANGLVSRAEIRAMDE